MRFLTAEVREQKEGDLKALLEIKQICLGRACEKDDIFDVIGVKVHYAVEGLKMQLAADDRLREKSRGGGQEER